MASYDVNGKVALVTGAARGIGYETARLLHARGASVALLDLDERETHAAAERIGPERTLGLGVDVTDRGALEDAVATTIESFGGLDALLSAAQMPPGVPVACVGLNSARNAAVLAARIIDC